MSGQIDSLIKARNKLEKEKLSILSEADQARISTRHLDKDEVDIFYYLYFISNFFINFIFLDISN